MLYDIETTQEPSAQESSTVSPQEGIQTAKQENLHKDCMYLVFLNCNCRGMD